MLTIRGAEARLSVSRLMSTEHGTVTIHGKEARLKANWPMKTKYGLRRSRGKNEFAQDAIQEICGGNPSADISVTWLWRELNDRLAKDPVYRATGRGSISRRTVGRLLERMHRR
jgi:hypothetical protein